MDFTLKTYCRLLLALQKAGYDFLRYEDYCRQKEQLPGRFVILRHDVDSKANNSLATAKIEAEMSIKATYYFRVVSQSNQPDIIRQIATLGHEIGYHYEDMTVCNGDVLQALAHFEKQLAYFRTFYPIKTICMHGAPRSKFDGKDLWKTNDYHNYGIIGEPYYDTDFSNVFYLTDTGRCWDGYKVSVRDKIPQYQDEWNSRRWIYHNTQDIIKAIESGRLPKQLMITTHPQRWTDQKIGWLQELVLQTLKNQIKRFLIRR